MNPKQIRIEQALAHLKAARDLLVRAEAPRAADYVRRAMKSTEGALRHAGRGDLFPVCTDRAYYCTPPLKD
jgi:hypothetical protein